MIFFYTSTKCTILTILLWLSEPVDASFASSARVSSFVPSFSETLRRQQRCLTHLNFAPRKPFAASSTGSRCISRKSTLDNANHSSCLSAAVSSTESSSATSKKSNEAPSNNNEEASNPSRDNSEINELAKMDKLALTKHSENIPLGQLTPQNKSDMLALMRQLSSMDRGRNDVIASFSHARQRRQDATIVERLLERLLKEPVKENENEAGNNNNDIDTVGGFNMVSAYNLAIKSWSNANVRGSAERAERVLKRLLDASKQKSHSADENIQPDIFSFAYCYAAWYRESIFSKEEMGDDKASSIASKKAESVLQLMKQMLMTKQASSLHPSSSAGDKVDDANTLLEMWSNVHRTTPDMAQRFLKFLDLECRGTNDLWIDTRSYNIVINAWANSGNKDSISQAEALVSSMEEKDSVVKPNLLSYSAIIACISKGEGRPDTERAEGVLFRMAKMQELGNGNVKPDTVIYNQVINLYSKSGSKGSAERAEKLLKRMHALASAGNFRVAPDVRTYNLVLSAYANENGPNAAADAEKILARLENHETVRPNSISYITCMDSYARTGDVHNSLRILSLLEKAFKEGNSDAKPNRRAYTSALNALAKSGRGDAGARADALVQAMETLFKEGNKDLEPDITVYNVLINCHKNSAEKAEQVLHRMGDRDVISYTSVINAYSQKGGIESAKRAQALLEEMRKRDLEPNAQTFNSVIMAWARSGGSKGSAKKAEGLLKRMEKMYDAGNMDLRPNAILYTSVITAWSKSNEPGSASRAEMLLKQMWTLYKSGNKEIKPNTRTFTAVIDAWARSGENDAGERAEALMDRMIKFYGDGDNDVKPNVQTLTAAVDAYARNGGRDSASKANSLVKKMESFGIKPNLQTNNVLISAWGNSQQEGSGMMAESILYKLEAAYHDGDADMKPTVISYTSCINAWAKSLESGKAKKAQAILERLKRNHKFGSIDVEPNEITYTAVINACATTYGPPEEKKEALKIAYKTFLEITESETLKPNHVTYSTFLRATSKLMPGGEKKDAIMSAAFRLCCKDGQVDDNCLFQLKNSASPELVSDLLGGAEFSDITIDDLPSDWKRNVKFTPRKKTAMK